MHAIIKAMGKKEACLRLYGVCMCGQHEAGVMRRALDKIRSEWHE
jgi:hypothetical protein